MKGLIRAREINGLPVVTIDGGEDVAEVRDVVYDGTAQKLIGFTLNKRGLLAGRMSEVLQASRVVGIGTDAVMIATLTDLNASAATTAEVASDDAAPVLANRVLSTSGTDLGEIIDVVIETDGEPSAVGYEVERDGSDDTVFIPISEQMTISADNLLVPADLEQFVSNDFAGFGAAVETYRNGQLDGGSA